MRARYDICSEQKKYLCLDLDDKAISSALKATATTAGRVTQRIHKGSEELQLCWQMDLALEYPVQAAASTTDLANRTI
ncbi:hypothetical protein PHMEG_00016590 [Phytophthora megakarya]|uniref:Uncharacterized protein n=1 Tax=Phytophthora megakarya TaxID=4795 RepID=A0A225VYG4_9STRA|nr:hypothetical protein PHMEG_00016590 [Phytophthora megakarya]